LKTGSVKWVVTSPYGVAYENMKSELPHPNFKSKDVTDWVVKHGNGVAVIGVVVEDAKKAFEMSTGVGQSEGEWAKGITPPVELKDEKHKGSVIIAEILAYGDTRIRFVQYKDGYDGVFLPRYVDFKDPHPLHYGIKRMDHVVGNVFDMKETVNRLKKSLGLHTFATFSKDEIKTQYSSLNSEVLSNNIDTVLMPINEPAEGEKASQITEYLEANNGAGVQHIALFTDSILDTIQEMQIATKVGGFEFISAPSGYYDVPDKKKILDDFQFQQSDGQKRLKDMGILVDNQGGDILLQIFTLPLFDRATLFVEIIQRACHGEVVDKAGCGGFGKGNFLALFQGIEVLQAQRGMLTDTKTHM